MTETQEREALGPGEWQMTAQWMSVDDLEPNPANPNEQTDAEFNSLVASIEQEGWTAPVTAVWNPETGKHRIVAGEHRWRAAKVLGCTVPVIPLDPAKWDQDRQDMMLVKDNIVTGKLNPAKFAELYERLSERYEAPVLQALMGFTSEDAFKKLYKGVSASLPPELAKALEESQSEIKTIDGLALLLNRLFNEHGETLPADFMAFSYGTKEVLWVTIQQHKDYQALKAAAERCHEAGESFSEKVLALLQADAQQAQAEAV